MKKIIKKTALFFLALFLFLLITFIIIRINENNHLERFEKTKINSSIESIKNIWGEPDYCSTDNQRPNLLVIKYKKGILGWNTYIFLINKTDKKLHSKYIDD